MTQIEEVEEGCREEVAQVFHSNGKRKTFRVCVCACVCGLVMTVVGLDAVNTDTCVKRSSFKQTHTSCCQGMRL